MRIPLFFFLKPLATLFLLVFFYANVNAQSYPPTSKRGFAEHVRFGGSVGLGFGNDFFSATLAPSAIYQVNRSLALGAGLNFSYASQDNFYKSTIFGGSLIGLYSPVPQVQLSAEFEELKVSRDFESDLLADQDYWYPALFLGAGYNTGPVTIGIRYDVLYDDSKSIYANAWAPFFRVYF